METSIIITSTEAIGGKKRKRSITDINPNATNEQLKDFAQAFNGLTTNQYVETDRVDKINVDNEGDRKTFRNLITTGTTVGATATIKFFITPEETTKPAVFYYTGGTMQVLSPTTETGTDTQAVYTVNMPGVGGVLYVGLPENDNFYSDFLRINIS